MRCVSEYFAIVCEASSVYIQFWDAEYHMQCFNQSSHGLQSYFDELYKNMMLLIYVPWGIYFHQGDMGLYSLSSKVSDQHAQRGLKAVRLALTMIVSFWNLIDVLVVLLQRSLLNLIMIPVIFWQLSWLRDVTLFGSEISHVLVNRDQEESVFIHNMYIYMCYTQDSFRIAHQTL